MKHLLLTICLSTLFISCKKDKLEGDKEIFIGKWEWVYTNHVYGVCTGYPPIEETLTPETEGGNYSMEFLKKGIVKYYENGIELDKDRLVFSHFSSDSYLGEDYYLFGVYLNNEFYNDDYRFQGSISTDTLIVNIGYPYQSFREGCESYVSYFIKQ